jgi:hypothetical protein
VEEKAAKAVKAAKVARVERLHLPSVLPSLALPEPVYSFPSVVFTAF